MLTETNLKAHLTLSLPKQLTVMLNFILDITDLLGLKAYEP